jgi:ribosomal protein S6
MFSFQRDNRKSAGYSVSLSFDYSSDALQEIESFFKRSHKVIVALTVQEILDEQIAKKLV